VKLSGQRRSGSAKGRTVTRRRGGEGRGAGSTDDKGAKSEWTDDHSAVANDKGSYKRHSPMVRVRPARTRPMKKVPYL